MAFHEYPYTDFHEMNLDWVIKKVKELATAWAQVQQDWTDEQAAFANLQSWIENYFNNLNVQTEINVKLDAMVEAGTMSELIAPFVASGLPAVVADQIGAVVAAQIGPVVAAQIGAVVADQLPAIAASAAATEVGTWLSTHVNPDTGYVIDDSLTVQGAAADAKAVGDEVTAIKSALSDLDKELVDRKIILETLKPTFVTRGGIDSSGIITSGTTSYDVFYFDVQNVSKIIVVATGGFMYATYSSIPQVGSQATDSTRHGGNNPITIGVGVKYVAVRCDHDTIPTAYNANQGVLVNEQLNKLQYDFDSVTKSYPFSVEATKHSDKYVDKNNTEASNNAWDYYTLSCEQYQKYDIDTMAYGDVRHWMILDGDNQIIKVAEKVATLTQREETIEIPSSGATLLINSNHRGTFSVVQVKTVVDEDYLLVNGSPIEEVIDGIANSEGNILHGKTLCCCGDSITFGDDMDAGGFDLTSAVTFYQWQGDYHAQYDGTWEQKTENVRKTWGYDIAKRNGMTFYNGGVNGSTMQGLDNKYGFSLANGRYTKLPDSIDYLLIWFGWNDTTYGTLGTINDATNESYYGGFNVVMPYLINKYPHAKIGLVVPYGTDTNHREAVRLLANKWGVACWDNYKGGTPLYYGKEDSVGVDADIVTANRSTFQAVGAHPNHYGHEYLSTMIENFLRSM